MAKVSMDPRTIEEIEQVDRRISFLRASLPSSEMDTNTETEPLDLSQLHEETKSEIKEQEALLQLLLQDKPRPWYYHRLPRELLMEIFKWVTHPAEQLKLQRIFSDLGDLMNWDSDEVLYFKLIYPLVQDYLWPDWHQIWRLCQVSPEFMRVVLHHFESSLSDNRTVDRRHKRLIYDFVSRLPEGVMTDITTLLDECDTLGRAEWMENMPFLVAFDFHYFMEEPPEFLIKFLDAHGQNIWNCHINPLMDSGRPPQAFLSRILSQTRNAVHLELRFFGINDNDNNALPSSLPDLPRLRSLRCMDPVSELVIQKYAPQLTSLFVQGLPPLVQDVKLFRKLKYFGSLFRGEVHDSIRESPLQTVRLFVSEDTQDIPKLSVVLCDLSHFGDTLQNLTLEFDLYSTRNWLVTGFQWRRRVRLPNLRNLELIRYQGKLDWLVALPSLQTLTLRYYKRRAKADVGQRTHPDLIYVSTRRITRFRTNIWTQLPNLRVLKIQNEKVLWNSSFRVTREEHEAYQNGSRFQKIAVTILAVCRESWAILVALMAILNADLHSCFVIFSSFFFIVCLFCL